MPLTLQSTAQQKVKETGDPGTPTPSNAPTQLLKELDHGKDYQYAHDHKNHFIDMGIST